MKRFLLLAVFLASCSSSEDEEFQFDRNDVDSALSGTWTGSFATGRSGTLDVVLRIAPPTAQAKCANRTLSTKCTTESEAIFEGTLTTSDGEFAAVPIKGYVMIGGTEFNNGYLDLTTADGVTLNAAYSGGALRDGTLRKAESTSTFTLARK